MQNLLILGAGRSASSLISYWCSNAEAYQVFITVADPQLELAQSKVNGCTLAKAISFNVENKEETAQLIADADLVISMLPAHLHLIVAEHCLERNRNLLTASYASNEIKALHSKAIDKGIIIMMECGLDPGLDHMSALRIIHHLKAKNASITSFKSYCGGLVAPESDTNPWHYKFSWNPRNVILAGQGTARYLDQNMLKYIPYPQLFLRTEKFEIPHVGVWEGYANRDSLSYIQLYGLETCQTFVRGTLRGEGYCEAWAQLIKLGLTDDSFTIDITNGVTWLELIKSFLPVNKPSLTIEQQLADYLKIDIHSALFQQLIWLDILSDQPLVLANASPAQHLQHLLEQKWKLEETDKDMIVMVHEFEYQLDGQQKKLLSSLKSIGDDQVYTAMAKTVGLPLAIASKMILKGEIQKTGVILPLTADIYEPILNELANLGIAFEEHHIE
jgi:saccharopine dehydrogenase-like NADP-dependent oxidoreductase